MINPFKKTYTIEQRDLFVFLSSINLFAPLTEKEMALFIPYMHERKYEQDEVVFFRNDPSHALYLLKKGRVSLNLDIHEKFEPLTHVEKGEALGASCLLKKKKRQLNAFVTSETADFYVIPQDNIFTIFESEPVVKTKMIEALAEIYSSYNANLFKTYKAAQGFFNLSQLYSGKNS